MTSIGHLMLNLTSVCRSCQRIQLHGIGCGRRPWASRGYTSKLGKEIPFFHKPKVNQRKIRKLQFKQRNKAFNELSKGLEVHHQKLLDSKELHITNSGRQPSSIQEGVRDKSSPSCLEIDLSTAEKTNKTPVIVDNETFREIISDKTFAKKLKKGFRLVSCVDSDGNEKNLTNKPNTIFLVEEEPKLIYTRTYDFDLSNALMMEKSRNSNAESVIESVSERENGDAICDSKDSAEVVGCDQNYGKEPAMLINRFEDDFANDGKELPIVDIESGEGAVGSRPEEEISSETLGRDTWSTFNDRKQQLKKSNKITKEKAGSKASSELTKVGDKFSNVKKLGYEHDGRISLEEEERSDLTKVGNMFSKVTEMGYGWISLEEEEMTEKEVMASDVVKGKGKKIKKADTGSDMVKQTIKHDVAETMLTAKQIETLRTGFNQDFLAFIQAHISIGQVQAAHSKLRLFNMMRTPMGNRAQIERIVDVEIFNSLLHAWAKQGNIAMMGEVWKLMELHSVEPNTQSFAASLECIGRKNVPSQTAVLLLLKKMDKMSYDIERVLRDSVLVKDEEEFVIKAVRQVVPNYQPIYDEKNICYHGNGSPEECPTLVQKLYQDTDPKVENPYAGVMSTNMLLEAVEKQVAREKQQYIRVRSVIASDEPIEFVEKNREKLKDLLNVWRNVLQGELEQRIHKLQKKQEASYGMSLYPFLKMLKLEEFVNIMIQEIEKYLATSEYYSPPIRELQTSLGKQVYTKVTSQQRARDGTLHKLLRVQRQFVKESNKKDFMYSTHLELWESICVRMYGQPSIQERKIDWSSYLQQKIGGLLMDIIMTQCAVDIWMFNSKKTDRKMTSAFYKVFRFHSNLGSYVSELKTLPVLTKLMRYCQIDQLTFNTEDIPMVAPPLPWTSKDSGGNILLHTDLVRAKFSVDTQIEFLSSIPDYRYFASLDALNKIAYCPWRLDTEMLDIMIGIFRNHGNEALGITPDLSTIPKLPEKKKGMTPKEKKEVYRRMHEINKLKAETYSLWCTDLYRLSIANMLRNEVFWFPHNMDFRSRIYPTSTYLNQQSEDLVRGFLRFANGKPLGEKGLDWLKIHLINLTGLKKRVTNAERLAYANEMMEEILDSADNPLTGRLWWQSADEPWQTLATCKDIANAVRSPNAKEYVSYLPTHQDGSCNGLQHYAAMGRDQSGAESVNLCPIDKPMDVYSDIMDLVEETRQKDAEEGVEIAQILEGFVKRKVIKQTIMTTVYGVTMYGAKLQILRQLKDIPEFPQEHLKDASNYLAEKTFTNLQKRFTATKEIQDWFTIISYMLSRYCREPVTWTTPLNMPVLQPYFSRKAAQSYATQLQLSSRNSVFAEIPDPLKQKNGFPPNFVHSLDSTHMMLTALYCWRAGIGFSSIHDCFWTHACDVDIMNKICREQFVALHSQPILENLSTELLHILDHYQRKHPDLHMKKATKAELIASIIKTIPRRGNFDLNNVLSSTYFFS